MINFKISDFFEGLITVVKPIGKPIPLNIGEIIKGEVMDILPGGGVTLRIKDSFITARTDIPLQKNSEVMLKVIGTPSSPNELKLQLIGEAEKEQAASPSPKGEALNRFLQQLPGTGSEKLTADRVEGLLKALPSDISSVPKEIMMQLKVVLQDSLKSTGQDIQSRLDELFRDLPAALKNQPDVQGLKLNVTVSVDKLLTDGLKGLLADTGVALESKLKAVAELLQQISKGEAGVAESGTAPHGAGAPPADVNQMLPAADKASIDNDLKANLLKLKELIAGQPENVSAKDATAIKNATAAIDGILKDIETYQLLSRTTESFYTFLPVNWEQLRDGEIAFKVNKGDGGTAPSFSCRLNLDLDNFGKLVIMVLAHNNEFFVSFRPESKDFKAMLDSHVEHLGEQFKEQGLNLKAVRVLDKNDTSLEQLENLEPFRRIVSIKA